MKPSDHSWFDYPNSIFVFGSNLKGIHVAGAAAFAYEYCNAQWDIGWGLTGQSYALPTCSVPGKPLNKMEVIFHIERFLKYAKEHLETQFFLTKVGCGFAGFEEDFIRVLFLDAPDNVIQPPDWYHLILQ